MGWRAGSRCGAAGHQSRDINLRLPDGGGEGESFDISQAGEGLSWWETGQRMLESGEGDESRLKVLELMTGGGS